MHCGVPPLNHSVDSERPELDDPYNLVPSTTPIHLLTNTYYFTLCSHCVPNPNCLPLWPLPQQIHPPLYHAHSPPSDLYCYTRPLAILQPPPNAAQAPITRTTHSSPPTSPSTIIPSSHFPVLHTSTLNPTPRTITTTPLPLPRTSNTPCHPPPLSIDYSRPHPGQLTPPCSLKIMWQCNFPLPPGS
jgi:hypothetical protein